MERNRQDIATLHAINPKGFPISSAPLGYYPIEAFDLFDSSRPLPSSLKNVPAPPFMVPAILDALSNSGYASVTEVVPDEADPYCARAAAASGAMILTGDSDMLVYDLGTHGAVAFLNTLDLRTPNHRLEKPNSCQIIEAAICQPIDLARKLNLENIQRLCFEIYHDPSITFLTALWLAKASPTNPQGLQLFLAQYLTPALPTIPSTPDPPKNQFLDPLTSTLLLQTIDLNPQNPPHFYLPILLDCPPKTFAWNPSSPLRFLTYAYALATSPHPHLQTQEPAQEFSRKGNRVVAEAVPRLVGQGLVEFATGLSARIGSVRDAFSSYLTAIHWRLFALHEILTFYSHAAKTPPSRNILVNVISGIPAANAKMWTWDDIHLAAQIQGFLYSLRMLGQILKARTPEGKFDDPAPFTELDQILGGLPTLAELLPSRMEVAKTISLDFTPEHVLERLTVMALGTGLGDANDVPAEKEGWEEQKTRKKRKGKIAIGAAEKKLEKTKGGNRYDVLGCD